MTLVLNVFRVAGGPVYLDIVVSQICEGDSIVELHQVLAPDGTILEVASRSPPWENKA